MSKDLYTGDLWNNPMVDQAKKALSAEDQENYARIGEEMFSTVDFENSTINQQDMEAQIVESAFYIFEKIKSGLHPSYLEEGEINVLEEAFGKTWYKKLGFKKSDVE